MTLAADRMRSRRQVFAAPGGSHDRVVRLLAIVLPGLIGVLAAIMLLAPLTPRGEISFLLDRTKVAIVDDRLRVVSAMYRGRDDKGRMFTIEAGSAVQHSVHRQVVEMNAITARFVAGQGPAILTAGAGWYDLVHQVMHVPGKIDFEASDGYSMQTSAAAIDLDSHSLTSDGPVDGRIPSGTFSADRIVASLDDHRVTLDGHAHLHMVPGKAQASGKTR